MNVLPCVLLLATVCGMAVSFSIFDSSRMASLVDQLISEKMLDENIKLSNEYKPCVDTDVFDCYTQMHSQYTDVFQKYTMSIFIKKITELTEHYNSLVYSYMLELTKDDKTGNVEELSISTIGFKDSKLFCVSFYIELFNVSELTGNHLIADYVFYYAFPTENNVQNKKVFMDKIKSYFKDEPKIISTPTDGFLSELTKLKGVINTFSKPFYELLREFNLVWKNGDIWQWTALKNSSQLPHILMDGQNIYDYVGLQEGNTLKNALNQFEKFNSIRGTIDHYTLIRNILKNYVIKVLFRKVMYVVTYTFQLQDYYGPQNLNVSDAERRVKQDSLDFAVFYIYRLVCNFYTSFRLFVSNKYQGYNSSDDIVSTIRASTTILDYLSSLVITRTLGNPMMAVQEINSVASSAFLTLIPNDGQDAINHYSKPPRVKPSPDDLITTMESINISLIYIIEAMKPEHDY